MTAAPRPSTTATPTRRTSELTRFLDAIYDGQAGGYVELNYIDGNPKTVDMTRHSWHVYSPSTVHALARRIDELIRQYGNVYVSRTSYSRRERNADYALPSVAVFIDDADAAKSSDATLRLRTSEGSRQAWYLLNKPTDAATIGDLATRAAAALGADTSGSDVVQLVRVPGAKNTKTRPHYTAYVENSNRRRFSVEELRQRWAYVPSCSNAKVSRRDVATFEQEHKAELERYAKRLQHMLCTTGEVQHPARLRPGVQGYKVLDGTFAPRNQSDTDTDYSLLRYTFVKSCLLHGYSDAATYVLALHFCTYRETLRNAEVDVLRCIRRVREKCPDIQTHGLILGSRAKADEVQPIAPPPAPPKRERGRPKGIDADAYYAALHSLAQPGGDGDGVIVVETVASMAERLDISRRKAAQLEAELRRAGRIGSRRRFNQNHSSYLELTPECGILGTAKNTEMAPILVMQKIADENTAESDVSGIATPQNDVQANATIEEHTPALAAPQGTPPGVCSSSPAADAAPSLGDMVRWALLAKAADVYRKRMSTVATVIAEAIAERFNVQQQPEYLHGLIRNVRNKLKYEVYADEVAAAGDAELWNIRRDVRRRQERAARREKRNEVLRWGHALRTIDAELERRGLPLVRPATPRKRKAMPCSTPVPTPPLLVEAETVPTVRIVQPARMAALARQREREQQQNGKE